MAERDGAGRDSHSGSTPMPGRRDALVEAARLISAVQRIALEHGPDGVGTVGELHVSPNSRNTVPGDVRSSIDLRHPEDQTLDAMDAAIVAAVAEQHSANTEMKMIWHSPPVRFDDRCFDAVERAASALAFPRRRMVSGAGHDACQVARRVPTAMVFIPCKHGLSHNEAEWAEPEHLNAGCQVLLNTALDLSQGPLLP